MPLKTEEGLVGARGFEPPASWSRNVGCHLVGLRWVTIKCLDFNGFAALVRCVAKTVAGSRNGAKYGGCVTSYVTTWDGQR